MTVKRKLICIFCAIFCILQALPATEITAANKGNLFDIYNSYCGIITESGSESYDIRYQTTEAIDARQGNTVTFGPCAKDQDLYITCLDSAGKAVQRVTSADALTSLGEVADGYSLYSMKLPSGTVSVRITLCAECWNIFVIYLGKTLTAEEYKAEVSAQGKDAYLEYIGADRSFFTGKSLLWCGDSVGAGSYEKYYSGAPKSLSKNNIAWAGRVANLLGIEKSKVLNTSAGGACLATGKHSATVIPKQVSNNAAKYDIVVIEGGNVDIAGYKDIIVPIGYISESYNVMTFAGENTILGALELAIYNAIKCNPDALIVCVVPYRAPANYNCTNAVDRAYKYYKYVCEKWGIPCIDLSTNDVTNAAIDNYPYAGDTFFYDNLHCTPLGYTITANEIAMRMIGLHTYSQADRHMPEDIPEYITKEGAEEPPAGDSTVKIDIPENIYDPASVTKGFPDEKGQITGSPDLFVTTDYIAVKPGDKLYIAPSSPYDDCVVYGYDSSKNAVTGQVNSWGVTGEDYFSSGRILYSYTVPDGVSYVRMAIENCVTPLITLNVPFTRAYYNYALGLTMSGGKPLGITEYNAASDTAPAEALTTAEQGSDSTAEVSEKASGCRSAICLTPVLAVLAAAGTDIVRRRKKRT